MMVTLICWLLQVVTSMTRAVLLLAARLYLNDGKGKFSAVKLPDVFTNASCVQRCDYDKDGYADVFIGGRAISSNYGKSGRSYLLHNDKGILIDKTPDILKEPGMVTDAAWNDLNGDTYPELILVGDWMPVTIFSNNKGMFENKQTSCKQFRLVELYSSQPILISDGDMDFVLGTSDLIQD